VVTTGGQVRLFTRRHAQNELCLSEKAYQDPGPKDLIFFLKFCTNQEHGLFTGV